MNSYRIELYVKGRASFVCSYTIDGENLLDVLHIVSSGFVGKEWTFVSNEGENESVLIRISDIEFIQAKRL